MTTINALPTLTPPVICDFGWYYGITPTRTAEATYTVGTSHYPPGAATLTAPVTLSTTTPFTISVGSTATFTYPGALVITDGTNYQRVTFAGISGNTFTGCLGGSGTFAANSSVYDPRFYVDQMPMRNIITFDAIDHQGLQLPVVSVPPGITINTYQWDFGNGQTGYGPFATTTYQFAAVPSSIQATLTVFDSIGRQFSCAHRLNLQSLQRVYGKVIRV